MTFDNISDLFIEEEVIVSLIYMCFKPNKHYWAKWPRIKNKRRKPIKRTKYAVISSQNVRHKFTGTSNQKTTLTKVVKEYALINERPCRPLNMQSFGHIILGTKIKKDEREPCILVCKIFKLNL